MVNWMAFFCKPTCFFMQITWIVECTKICVKKCALKIALKDKSKLNHSTLNSLLDSLVYLETVGN